MWLSALPKTVGRKNAITARLSYCLCLTFLTEFMNIYESILHLNLETPTSMFGWWHFLCFLKVSSYRKIKVLAREKKYNTETKIQRNMQHAKIPAHSSFLIYICIYVLMYIDIYIYMKGHKPELCVWLFIPDSSAFR